MKLAIEIPEEAYKLLKTDGVDWLGAEHILNAVANGKPLGSVFDDIKADIEKARYGLINDGLDRALEIIDAHLKKLQ